MSAPDPLAQLRTRFIARAAEDLATLRGHLDGAPRDPAALRFTIHRLSGSAGTFGYAEVSQAAGQAEDDLLDNPDDLDASLRRLIEVLARVVESSRE
jgi:HPt (histidine-containing phosphotransfer) domain-containing protein